MSRGDVNPVTLSKTVSFWSILTTSESPLSTIIKLSEESIDNPSRFPKFSAEPAPPISSPVSEPSGFKILMVFVLFCATKICPVLFCATPTGLVTVASSMWCPSSS